MKLFDYQEIFVSDIQKAFRHYRTVVGQLATGGGKGVVIAEIVRRAILKGSVVCVAAHRIEIFEQIYKNLKAFGIQPSLIMPGVHPMPGAQVYISMVETFCRRMKRDLTDRLNINFFILDEIHFGSYYKLMREVECKVLGFTATPLSTGNPHLKDYFETIVCGIPISDLISIGRLVPAITYSQDYDFSKVKRKGKEFDATAIANEFKKPKLRDGAIKMFMRYAKDRQALLFSTSCENSNEKMRHLRDLGIDAVHIDGSTPSRDREILFSQYRSGKIQVICNVGIATTGTDLPNTGCVIEDYASLSMTKIVQVKGRGGRTAPGKENFINIDMGSNYIRGGSFGEDINWMEIFQDPGKDTEEKAKRTKRVCDTCGAVIKFSLTSCPYCNAFTPKGALEKMLMQDASIKEIREYKIKNMPHNLRKDIKSMDYRELCQYAQHMGYKPSWVHVVMQRRKHS